MALWCPGVGEVHLKEEHPHVKRHLSGFCTKDIGSLVVFQLISYISLFYMSPTSSLASSRPARALCVSQGFGFAFGDAVTQ